MLTFMGDSIMPYTIIACLYATEKGLSALQDFESKVLPLLADHGGQLVSAFAPELDILTQEETPDEVHVLQFPSKDAFAAYRADPRHQALSGERNRAIRKTRILAGIAFAPHYPNSPPRHVIG